MFQTFNDIWHFFKKQKSLIKQWRDKKIIPGRYFWERGEKRGFKTIDVSKQRRSEPRQTNQLCQQNIEHRYWSEPIVQHLEWLPR